MLFTIKNVCKKTETKYTTTDWQGSSWENPYNQGPAH